MEYTVRIHKGNDVAIYKAETGTRLLDFLRDKPVRIDTPCGGRGTCGKCRVRAEGLSGVPSDREKRLLGDAALKDGIRLACFNRIDNNLDIYDIEEEEKAIIITEGHKRDVKLEPVIKKEYAELDVPKLDDQASDLERVLRWSRTCAGDVDMGLVMKLPGILRNSDFKVTLVHAEDRLIGVEPGNTVGKLYGVAFDIGTTTIASYLFDLNTGCRLDVHSMLNPQRKYGADVISRIGYAMASDGALAEVNGAIIDCINAMINHFTDNNNLASTGIYAAVFVGNTTMMHLLMGIDARNIAVAPFIPVTTSIHRIPADALGIKINKCGVAVMFPSVSAYIGADTVAAVLSSGMYEKDDISLLVDIGTNGEIVLGNKDRMFSCSTAAGPAFEGANIRNGVGGINGAIDTVVLKPSFGFTTINNKKPVGICGSGIVDVIAQMLAAGLIDETGRIADKSEIEGFGAVYRERLVDMQGERSFLLSAGVENAANSDIAITQKDIRELQNAKAAMAAGIRTLIKHAGIKYDDIKNVYLAGGFGSRINIKSALDIGLLPRELEGRIESIGNAAGEGATEGLLSAGMLSVSEQIKERIRYIELSAEKDFVDNYIECMMLE